MQGGDAAGTCPDPEDEDLRRTDEELYADLLRDGFGGFGGLAWDVYCDTPDRVLLESYLAERDEEHQVVTRRQKRRLREQGGVSGIIERAGRELPSREELRIPDAAWAVNPRLALDPSGQAYCLMFWQVWRRRQAEGVLTEDGSPISDEYLMGRWRARATDVAR